MTSGDPQRERALHALHHQKTMVDVPATADRDAEVTVRDSIRLPASSRVLPFIGLADSGKRYLGARTKEIARTEMGRSVDWFSVTDASHRDCDTGRFQERYDLCVEDSADEEDHR